MDREKVIEGLEQIINDPFMKAKADYWVLVCSNALALLKEQGVKKSKWLSLPYKKDRVCERCGHDEPYKFADKESDVFLYCPHCGAKMINDK